MKDLVQRTQRQDTNWEKISAKYIFDKGFGKSGDTALHT